MTCYAQSMIRLAHQDPLQSFMSKQTSCSCQLTLAPLSQSCRSTRRGCCFPPLLHQQEPAWLLSCGMHLACLHLPRNAYVSLQHPQRSSQPMGEGSRLLCGKGIIPVFMNFPAAADSCLYALFPVLSQNKQFKHQFGTKAVGKGKASLSTVRKFKIAGFPLQLHLNKKAACSEQKPIQSSQPKCLGWERQCHTGEREGDAGRGSLRAPQPLSRGALISTWVHKRALLFLIFLTKEFWLLSAALQHHGI